LVTFLYPNNEIAERKCKKKTFKTAPPSKKKKILRINLTKELKEQRKSKIIQRNGKISHALQ